mgnify:CR=1 FL=1|tara:strand:- start:4792 stop:5334 length:543 start_codon:yes stop_codon:yes gene_type:complete
MNKLFVKSKTIPFQSLLDIQEDNEAKLIPSQTYTSKKGNSIDNTFRESHSKVLKPKEYPEISNELFKFLDIFDGTKDPNKYKLGELEYIEYGVGGKFKKHRDVLKVKEGQSTRAYSSSTLISKTDDLEGGALTIYSSDGYPVDIHLEPGETIFFSSDTLHEVKEITKGYRKVLVAWIHKI